MPQTNFEISSKLLQRCIIWWLWKQGRCGADIWRDLTFVFGQDTYHVDSVRHWIREFNQGRVRITDMDRSGRPRTARSADNVEAVLEIVSADRKKRVAEIAMEVQLSHSSVHRILRKDLNMHKKAAKFVPHLLTQRHKDQRLEACRQNLRWLRMEPSLMDKIITADKSYIHLYQPGNKEDTKEWLLPGEPRPPETPARTRQQVLQVHAHCIF